MAVNANVRKISESQRLYERAQAHLVDGVGSGTRAPRSGWLPCPVFVREGSGPRVTDVDGNTYIDYQMGQGPLILGHRPPAVIEAVTETINEPRLPVRARLRPRGGGGLRGRRAMPSVDVLRFGQSGTECVMYALRFARAGTGRNLIVRFEGHYHGWSDAIHWSAHPSLDEAGPADAPAVSPSSTGIAREVGESLLVLPWADEAALDRAFDEHGADIAGVICEPILGNCGGIMPPPGWLEKLRETTRANGSMLIFDEVLTGLRVGPGGAQGLLGVEPDLTVMAKALAAGFPVAAIGGTAEAMSVLTEGRTMHGGTYNSNPLVCSAVVATMKETGAPGFYEELTRKRRAPRAGPGRRRARRRRRRPLDRDRPVVPAVVRRAAAGLVPRGPGGGREEPVPHLPGADARAGRAVAAAPGGAVLELGGPRGRRDRRDAGNRRRGDADRRRGGRERPGRAHRRGPLTNATSRNAMKGRHA